MPMLLALTLFAATLPLFTPLSVSAGSASTGKPVIAGYYPSYSGQTADAIPYTSFTHLDFFVAGTADQNWLDWYGASDELIRSVVTQAHAKKVTVSLCIGGWTGSKYFSRHVADAGSRQGFADVLKGVVDKYGFDGIDIDWEHIGRDGADGNIVSRDDAANFKRFLPLLRKALGDKARISISLSVAGMTDENGNTITNYRAYAKYIDYWNVMGYDVFGPWPGSPASGPNAPLYQTCPSAFGLPFSLSSGVYLLVHGGVPKSHIITGLAAYGHAFRTKSSVLTPKSINNVPTFLFQPVEGAASQDGMTYSQMIRSGLLSRDGWTGQAGYTRYFDRCTGTPFLFSASARTLISYDDAESIGIKASWAKKQGLAGCNFFDTTGDYAPTLPLVNAARKGFGLSYFQESAPNSRIKTASIDDSQAAIDSVPRKGAGPYHAHSVPPSI